jgi:small GTP-binding protein
VDYDSRDKQEMTEVFNYDVFISHSSIDKHVVRELAKRLKADGVRVWLDEWEIEPGDMIGLKIDKGLEQSRMLLLVMSANTSESEWVSFESQTIRFTDPTNQRRRFIPLRLDGAEIKGTLKQFAYVDWRQKSDEQYLKLLAACRPPTITEELGIEQKSEMRPSQRFADHSGYVERVAMTADGRRAVSASADKTVRVWDLERGICLITLEGHTGVVYGVAMSEDGGLAVSGSVDNTVRVWDLEMGICLHILEGHTDMVLGVSLTPDGRLAVSGSRDATVRVWDVKEGKCLTTLRGHTNQVWDVAIDANGHRAISGSADCTVRIWDMKRSRCLDVLRGHTGPISGVAIDASGDLAVSSSDDKTVRVWDLGASECFGVFEGHTDIVREVAMTSDGQRVVSGSDDKTMRVWDLESGKCLSVLEGHTKTVFGVAIAKDGRRVISGSWDGTILVWDLPTDNVKEIKEIVTTRYTNAKVLLVGDSGVGKTGLAYRLTEDRFENTVSTDGVWATQLKLPHETNSTHIEREIWIWDFAGQADYRLIHQLFMDETALAVLVFNPQSENPFDGLRQWDLDLQRAARRPFKKLLVAGRCDRGGLMVSRNNIEYFRQEHGFVRYLETSAYTGDGCDALRDVIIHEIPWDDIPWTASPRIFKLLKEEIVKLKDEGKVLLRISELKQHLEVRLPGEAFTLKQLMAVIGLLAGPGIVWQLEFGDFLLLQPGYINAYAAAVIRKVRAHMEEIGIILEENVLNGKLNYQDMQRLPFGEEQIVLRAMHQTFVNHGLCLREPTEAGTLLVFPSYFKRKRPEQPNHPFEMVTYQVSGALDEMYATLVVKLRHTAAFSTDEKWLWKFAADFKTQANKRMGFKMDKKAEGKAEIVVYCEPGIPEDTKATFIRYIHDHLKAKDPNVTRTRHYTCPNSKCGERVNDIRAIERAFETGKKKIPCQYCGKSIPLFDLIEEKFASEKIKREVRALEEKSRSTIDKQSRELLLDAHVLAIAAETGQFFRPMTWVDWGIDGAIEFKSSKGEASGQRIYLQLKSGNFYVQTGTVAGKEIFTIKNERYAEFWRNQVHPVMLVICATDSQIRWMDVSGYLNQHGTETRQIVFDSEPFTALNLMRLKDKLMNRIESVS